MFEVLDLIQKTYTGEHLDLLNKAYDYAKKAHENQKRASGEDYFIHPCFVAKILIDLGLDSATVAAAFLHDVLEDTPVSSHDIEKEFGMTLKVLI